tara:strand:+ start:9017 stop:9430 length:414 start_codon:yes stop_codon:yes gene_type:complete
MNDSKSFDDIVNSLDKLNKSEQDALLHILEKDKVETNRYIPTNVPFFFTLSSIWFVTLLFGGVLYVEPTWLRYILLPLFGIPFAISYVYQVFNYEAKKDFKLFLIMSFFIGPIIGFFWGLTLSAIIYYAWELIVLIL